MASIDARLHRQEWAAAEAEARTLLGAQLEEGNPDFRVALPRLALAEAGQGRQEDAPIVFEGTITTTGEVRNLHILKAGLPVMEGSVLDAVCDWRFKPAMYRGEPVPVYYSLSFNF